MGDNLYSKQPFIGEPKDKNMSYICKFSSKIDNILVAKPKNHKLLMEWVSEHIKLTEKGVDISYSGVKKYVTKLKGPRDT